MAFNKELHKENLEELTLDLFKQAFFLALRDGVTSVAPLGFSGDIILLYGINEFPGKGRVSQVSFRMYCEDVEMLITDIEGHFLFYGRLRKELGVEYVLNVYWNVFLGVKDSITTEVKRSEKDLKISPNVTYTVGWQLLNMKIPSKYKYKENIFKKFFKKIFNIKNWF